MNDITETTISDTRPICRVTVENIAMDLAANVDGLTPEQLVTSIKQLHLALGWNELYGCDQCYALLESGFINDDGYCEDCDPEEDDNG